MRFRNRHSLQSSRGDQRLRNHVAIESLAEYNINTQHVFLFYIGGIPRGCGSSGCVDGGVLSSGGQAFDRPANRIRRKCRSDGTMTASHAKVFDEVVSVCVIGEMGNQLVGRMKNKWLKYRSPVRLSTPLVVSGVSLNLRNGEKKSTRLYSFRDDAGRFKVFLDVQAEEGFDFVKYEDTEAADEGDVILF